MYSEYIIVRTYLTKMRGEFCSERVLRVRVQGCESDLRDH